MNVATAHPSPPLFTSAARAADAHACNVARACERLSAQDYGDCFAYVDEPTGCAYVVDDEAMALLGRMLADGTPDAYVKWSTATGAQEIDAHVIIPLLARGTDLAVIRAQADADADFAAVVAIDLLRPTLEALLASEDDGDYDANEEAPAPGSDTVGRALY